MFADKIQESQSQNIAKTGLGKRIDTISEQRSSSSKEVTNPGSTSNEGVATMGVNPGKCSRANVRREVGTIGDNESQANVK